MTKFHWLRPHRLMAILSVYTLLLSVCLGTDTNRISSSEIYYNIHQHQQSITEHPSDQQAKIGERALFKCRIRNLRGEPQWCIDDFCLGLTKPSTNWNGTKSDKSNELHLKGRPRYRIVGDRSRGEFNLLVEPVQLQDNMFFYCMATAASETVKAIKSKTAFLTVLTYPKSLHLDAPVHVSLNKPSSIQCVGHQSRPPVRILIAINGQLITDEFKYSTEIVEIPISHSSHHHNHHHDHESNHTNPSLRRYSLLSGLSIASENLRASYYDTYTNVTIEDISMEMQGKVVECFAYSFLTNEIATSRTTHQLNEISAKINSFQSDIMSTKSSIQVDYAPEVNLKIVSANRLLKEDDVISLVCETKANPPIHSYRWYIDKSHLNGVRDSNLNLKLRKEMHMKTVTCEASNAVASVKASIQLHILFKPSFVLGSKSFMLIDKSACNRPLTLDCGVNSNPSANITWYRRRLNRVYAEHLRARQSTKRSANSQIEQQIEQSINTDDRSRHFDSDSPFRSDGDLFEDELVGTGPTYTIASFNCANLVKNSLVRNRTKSKNVKRNVETSQEILVTDSTETSTFSDDDIDYSDAKKATNIVENSEYFYEYDEAEESELDNSQSGSSRNEPSEVLSGEYSDFGVYICEARNRIDDVMYENSGSNVVKRYIKLNPNGPPILRALQLSTSQNLVSEDLVTFMMKTSPIQFYSLYQETTTMEISSSIGASVTLTCFIEPLPKLEKLIWTKDNGKIIPNSKYSIYDDEQNRIESSSSIESTDLNKQSKMLFSNFKVKFDNVTVFEAKKDEQYFSRAQTSKIEENQGVSSTDVGNLGLMRTVLTIRAVRKEDFGVYKCKSSNVFGSRSVSIILREKTLMDKINLNSYVSFVFLVCTILVMFSLLVLLLMCVISKRSKRQLCCCCDCCDLNKPSRSSIKEKKLLEKNLHCELNSDKVINEWLASSKLSNDTATTTTTTRNGSMINGTATATANSSSRSKTAAPPLSCNHHSNYSKNHNTSHQYIPNSPINSKTNEINCSSNNNGNYDNHERKIGEDLQIDLNEFRLPAFNKSHQLTGYLVSSPAHFAAINAVESVNSTAATTASSGFSGQQQKRQQETDILIDTMMMNSDECEPMNSSTSEESATTVTSSTIPYNNNNNNNASPSRKLTPVRTHVLTNGNFNAKITSSTKKSSATIVSTPSLSELSERFTLRKQTPTINSNHYHHNNHHHHHHHLNNNESISSNRNLNECHQHQEIAKKAYLQTTLNRFPTANNFILPSTANLTPSRQTPTFVLSNGFNSKAATSYLLNDLNNNSNKQQSSCKFMDI